MSTRFSAFIYYVDHERGRGKTCYQHDNLYVDIAVEPDADLWRMRLHQRLCHNYFDDVDILMLLAKLICYLYPTNLNCIDIHRRYQVDWSTTLSNALYGIYLLTTILHSIF
jgi:hypothetical protein